ncbi:FAD-dependent oxidoreductase [Microbacterium sp. A204]|uniref:FAD-dependent oxidoreductase n=1 Tax=Microbacterium sp. A204 TaxID=3457321 RepID=UPI003FCF4A02
MRSETVTVIGAGIIGLTCASLLVERGHRVSIIAEHIEQTTSTVAASVWSLPFVEQSARVRAWATATRDRFRMETDPAAGMREVEMVTFAVSPYAPDPWVNSFTPRLRIADEALLPEGYRFGSITRTTLIDTSRYLTWLRGRLESLGVILQKKFVSSLSDLPGKGTVVVATGHGSRALAGDELVTGMGTTVIRLANPGLDRVTVVRDGEQSPLFIVPRFDDVIVGGHSSAGRASTMDIDRVLRRAAIVEPRLGGAHIQSVEHGVRPLRPTIRVEADMLGDRRVVYCYGHGGAGVATSWGSAMAAIDLVEGD